MVGVRLWRGVWGRETGGGGMGEGVCLEGGVGGGWGNEEYRKGRGKDGEMILERCFMFFVGGSYTVAMFLDCPGGRRGWKLFWMNRRADNTER